MHVVYVRASPLHPPSVFWVESGWPESLSSHPKGSAGLTASGRQVNKVVMEQEFLVSENFLVPSQYSHLLMDDWRKDVYED